MSQHQTHSKFQFFISPLSPDGSLPPELCSQVSAFVGPGVCARSIGAEFVASRGIAIVSLGYTEEQGHPVSLSCVKVGQLEEGKEVDTTKLSSEMEAAAPPGGVICQEFYVDSQDDVYAVFLSFALV